MALLRWAGTPIDLRQPCRVGREELGFWAATCEHVIVDAARLDVDRLAAASGLTSGSDSWAPDGAACVSERLHTPIGTEAAGPPCSSCQRQTQ